MKLLFALVTAGLLLSPPRAQAEGTDDQYVRIYNLIQEADSLNKSSQHSPALAKYFEAQTALTRFQRLYPDWNPRVIAFRQNYVAGKIAGAGHQVPATSTTAPPKPAPGLTATFSLPPRSGGTNALENQLNTLKNQVRQLNTDNQLLESKLKESLAAQPPGMDPRDLTRAQGKIQSLQKENELLKVTLGQEKSKPSKAVDNRAVEQTQQFLAEANRKLAEQTEKANKLDLERTALQNKLAAISQSPANSEALATTKKSLDEANAKLEQQAALAAKLALEKKALQAQLKTATAAASDAAEANAKIAPEAALARKLAAEKEALEAKVRELSAESETAAAMRAENQILKKQLADLQAASSRNSSAADASHKLELAQAEIAALHSDRDVLRLEKMALENRLKQLSARTVTTTVMPPPARFDDTLRVQQLERERDDLQKKLAVVTKEAYGRNGQAVAARVSDMENQVTVLRARLEVFEARQVPYTPEELALFKAPQIKLASSDPNAGKRSIKELPAGSAKLVANAQRYFSAGQFSKAEAEYLQVLNRDPKNAPALANLAVIQIQLGRLADAEKSINQAIALAPQDPYNLLILGQLRFRQEKYDEAVNALSRAAKLDPQDAQIQNFLGLSLCEKGMRGPGETALRKAIQIEPGYSDAHNNLAVIYITQEPPAVELARWHYQKALAAGHPRNADLEKMLDSKTTASTGQ